MKILEAILMTNIALLPFQSIKSQGIELKIGDTIREFRGQTFNCKEKTISSGHFNEKSIIFYFWSTYCKSCIASIPKLDSLNKQFGKNLQIVLVTYEKYDRVKSIWERNLHLQNIKLYSVIEDSILSAYFPHDGVPHLVWIDGRKQIKAITNSKYLTASNIETFLRGERLNWAIRKTITDYKFDSTMLSAADNGGGKPTGVFYSTVTNFLEYIPGSYDLQTNTAKGYRRFYAMNQSIPSLYNLCINRSLVKEIIWETTDSAALFYSPDSGYLIDWERKNAYCYESVLPLHISEAQLKEWMRLDLDKFFDFYSRIEYRMRNCLILKKKNNAIASEKKTAGIGTLYRKISDITDAISLNLKIPVIDETGIDEFNQRIQLPSWESLDKISEALNLLGLELIQANRKIPVFVISKTTSP